MLLFCLHYSVGLPLLIQWKREEWVGNKRRRKNRDSIKNFRNQSIWVLFFYTTHWNIKGKPQTKENENEKSIQKEWWVWDGNWYWMSSKRNANSLKGKE